MKTNKTTYALMAFFPLAMVLVLFVLMGMMFSQLAYDVTSNVPYRNQFELPYFVPLMLVGVLTSISSIIGMISYIMHSQRNILIPKDKRTMWLLIILLTGTIGKIIYYFSFISKEEELLAKQSQGGL